MKTDSEKDQIPMVARKWCSLKEKDYTKNKILAIW